MLEKGSRFDIIMLYNFYNNFGTNTRNRARLRIDLDGPMIILDSEPPPFLTISITKDEARLRKQTINQVTIMVRRCKKNTFQIFF